jgi:hypothetical protein
VRNLFHRILPLDNAYEEKNDGCHEEEMDEPADIIEADQAEDPQNEQDDCDSCKHDVF